MFPAYDSPDRVITTPAATARLTALAAESGAVAVLLSDEVAQVLPQGEALPSGAVHLGRLDGTVTFAARADSRTNWWCNRAVIDLRPTDNGQAPALSFELSPLDEADLYAAIAAGPLPRY